MAFVWRGSQNRGGLSVKLSLTANQTPNRATDKERDKPMKPNIAANSRYPRMRFARDLVFWFVENDRRYRAMQDIVETERR